MHLSGYWHDFIEEQGNAPGRQQGDVTVSFTQPLAGLSEVTLPSNDVTIVAEAGSVHGIQLRLEDGRRVFAFAGAVAGIADAPAEEREVKQPRVTEADSLTTGGANVPSAGTAQGPAGTSPEAARAEQLAAGAPKAQAGLDEDEPGTPAGSLPLKPQRGARARAGEAAAAHDKAEAAHDKSEAADDKAEAERRRPGK